MIQVNDKRDKRAFRKIDPDSVMPPETGYNETEMDCTMGLGVEDGLETAMRFQHFSAFTNAPLVVLRYDIRYMFIVVSLPYVLEHLKKREKKRLIIPLFH